MSTVIVIVYGVYEIAAGNITMGALIAATILTGRALAPLGAVAAMLTRLQQSRVALKSLDSLMKAPVERAQNKQFLHQNGRASCRERVCKYVSIAVVAGSLKKKKRKILSNNITIE